MFHKLSYRLIIKINDKLKSKNDNKIFNLKKCSIKNVRQQGVMKKSNLNKIKVLKQVFRFLFSFRFSKSANNIFY
jgi:hypothetical protein